MVLQPLDARVSVVQKWVLRFLLGSSLMGDSGGGSSRVEGPSFADSLHGSLVVDDFPIREPSTKFGRLAIILTSMEVAKLSLPYKTALIFNFFSSYSFYWGAKGSLQLGCQRGS